MSFSTGHGNDEDNANSALAFLRRNLLSCNVKIKSDAYLMYVRPILEYAICSWSPHSKRNIDKLESVQRRAARFVMGNYCYTSSVTEMLNSLKWPSISLHVNIMKLQMMYKIIHGIVDLKLPDYIPISQEDITITIDLPYHRNELMLTNSVFSHQQSPNGIDFQPVLSMLPQLILLLT